MGGLLAYNHRMVEGRTGLVGFAVAAGEFNAVSAVLWGLGVVLVIVLGGAVLLWLRKKLLGRGSLDDTGFASLETLRKQGLVTEEELRAISRRVVDRHQARRQREQDTDKGGPGGKSNLTPEADLSDSNTTADE